MAVWSKWHIPWRLPLNNQFLIFCGNWLVSSCFPVLLQMNECQRKRSGCNGTCAKAKKRDTKCWKYEKSPSKKGWLSLSLSFLPEFLLYIYWTWIKVSSEYTEFDIYQMWWLWYHDNFGENRIFEISREKVLHHFFIDEIMHVLYVFDNTEDFHEKRIWKSRHIFMIYQNLKFWYFAILQKPIEICQIIFLS